MRSRPCRSRRRSASISRARAVSIASGSSQPCAVTGLMMTISGGSASSSRRIHARRGLRSSPGRRVGGRARARGVAELGERRDWNGRKRHGRERVGSVRQFSEDGVNPHLERIFPFGANPTLCSSIQTTAGTGPLRPGWCRSPTKQTVSLGRVFGAPFEANTRIRRTTHHNDDA